MRPRKPELALLHSRGEARREPEGRDVPFPLTLSYDDHARQAFGRSGVVLRLGEGRRGCDSILGRAGGERLSQEEGSSSRRPSNPLPLTLLGSPELRLEPSLLYVCVSIPSDCIRMRERHHYRSAVRLTHGGGRLGQREEGTAPRRRGFGASSARFGMRVAGNEPVSRAAPSFVAGPEWLAMVRGGGGGKNIYIRAYLTGW